MAKLLLVEDDNNLREIYQARLAAEGYDIVTAQNGEEALVVAKQQKPDLVISDVMMPRISGFEMLDILRNTPELRDTKVIMLTALGQAEDQARAGKLGADKYLVKSQVTLEDIVTCAKDLLAGTTVLAPSPDSAEPAVSDTPIPSEPSVQAEVPATAPTAAVQPMAITTPNPTLDPQPPAPNPEPFPPVPAPSPLPDDSTAQTTATTAPAVAPLVSVQDPDPLTPQASPAPNSEAASIPTPPPTPSIVTHSAPIIAQETTATTSADTTAIPDPVPSTDPISSQPSHPLFAQPAQANPTPVTTLVDPGQQTSVTQTAASEEAIIESQIAAFAGAQTSPVVLDTVGATPAAVEPAPVQPQLSTPAMPTSGDTPNTDTANQSIIDSAVDELHTAASTPPPPLLPPSQQTVPGETPNPIAPPSIDPPDVDNSTAQDAPVVAADTPPVTTTAQDIPVEASMPVPETPVTPPAADPTPTPPEPTVITPTSVESSESEQVNVAGKKVIKPINDIAHGPNLDELLAKEVAKETAAMGTGAAPAVVAGAVTPGTPSTPPATPSVDPNSIAL